MLVESCAAPSAKKNKVCTEYITYSVWYSQHTGNVQISDVKKWAVSNECHSISNKYMKQVL